MTIVVSEDENQDFSDHLAFLAVKLLFQEQQKAKTQYALIELPTDLDRFVVLPKIEEKQYVMFLDDLISISFSFDFQLL